jgi:hypothetical protein
MSYVSNDHDDDDDALDRDERWWALEISHDEIVYDEEYERRLLLPGRVAPGRSQTATGATLRHNRAIPRANGE